jgi:DNA-binding transcriptional ArsR family regulator
MTADRGPIDPKTGAVGKAAGVEARLRERYLDAQYAYVQYLSEHLADCARAFDGDLAQLLVLAVLGQERLEAVRRDGPSAAPSAMNATRIADVTGLPRETVRRKLARLEARGWIHRVDRAGWVLTSDDEISNARLDLADLDARGLARLARLYVQIERIVRD